MSTPKGRDHAVFLANHDYQAGVQSDMLLGSAGSLDTRMPSLIHPDINPLTETNSRGKGKFAMDNLGALHESKLRLRTMIVLMATFTLTYVLLVHYLVNQHGQSQTHDHHVFAISPFQLSLSKVVSNLTHRGGRVNGRLVNARGQRTH